MPSELVNATPASDVLVDPRDPTQGDNELAKQTKGIINQILQYEYTQEDGYIPPAQLDKVLDFLNAHPDFTDTENYGFSVPRDDTEDVKRTNVNRVVQAARHAMAFVCGRSLDVPKCMEGIDYALHYALDQWDHGLEYAQSDDRAQLAKADEFTSRLSQNGYSETGALYAVAAILSDDRWKLVFSPDDAREEKVYRVVGNYLKTKENGADTSVIKEVVGMLSVINLATSMGATICDIKGPHDEERSSDDISRFEEPLQVTAAHLYLLGLEQHNEKQSRTLQGKTVVFQSSQPSPSIEKVFDKLDTSLHTEAGSDSGAQATLQTGSDSDSDSGSDLDSDSGSQTQPPARTVPPSPAPGDTDLSLLSGALGIVNSRAFPNQKEKTTPEAYVATFFAIRSTRERDPFMRMANAIEDAFALRTHAVTAEELSEDNSKRYVEALEAALERVRAYVAPPAQALSVASSDALSVYARPSEGRAQTSVNTSSEHRRVQSPKLRAGAASEAGGGIQGEAPWPDACEFDDSLPEVDHAADGEHQVDSDMLALLDEHLADIPDDDDDGDDAPSGDAARGRGGHEDRHVGPRAPEHSQYAPPELAAGARQGTLAYAIGREAADKAVREMKDEAVAFLRSMQVQHRTVFERELAGEDARGQAEEARSQLDVHAQRIRRLADSNLGMSDELRRLEERLLEHERNWETSSSAVDDTKSGLPSLPEHWRRDGYDLLWPGGGDKLDTPDKRTNFFRELDDGNDSVRRRVEYLANSIRSQAPGVRGVGLAVDAYMRRSRQEEDALKEGFRTAVGRTDVWMLSVWIKRSTPSFESAWAYALTLRTEAGWDNALQSLGHRRLFEVSDGLEALLKWHYCVLLEGALRRVWDALVVRFRDNIAKAYLEMKAAVQDQVQRHSLSTSLWNAELIFWSLEQLKTTQDYAPAPTLGKEADLVQAHQVFNQLEAHTAEELREGARADVLRAGLPSSHHGGEPPTETSCRVACGSRAAAPDVPFIPYSEDQLRASTENASSDPVRSVVNRFVHLSHEAVQVTDTAAAEELLSRLQTTFKSHTDARRAWEQQAGAPSEPGGAPQVLLSRATFRMLDGVHSVDEAVRGLVNEGLAPGGADAQWVELTDGLLAALDTSYTMHGWIPLAQRTADDFYALAALLAPSYASREERPRGLSVRQYKEAVGNATLVLDPARIASDHIVLRMPERGVRAPTPSGSSFGRAVRSLLEGWAQEH